MTTPPELFLGRDAEIDALERVLDGGVRLATIVGPLGAGKTRLAREFCARRGEATCFVDLTDVFERDAFFQRMASRLGVALSGSDPIDQIGSALEASELDVVVLDNAEQIVGIVREVVAALVSRQAIPRLVVTTREALDLAAEVRIALGSLPNEDAVRLFERRARDIVPTFEVAPEDRATVAAMLAELDNLPLVIELAASRVAVLPPAQLLKRLTDRFRHVRETQPRRTPRQASLEGAIAWSWDLLDNEERRALARSSVFRGGFSLEAAEEVLGVDDPITTVQSLVAKSLLRREASVRDAMDVRFHHYESVRAFAAQRLDDDGAADAHAAYFARLAAELGAPLRDGAGVQAQAAALGRLDEELGNLLVALQHAQDAEVGLAIDLLLEARGPAEMRHRVLTSFAGEGDLEVRRVLAVAETELARGRIDAARAWLHDVPAGGPEVALTAARIERVAGNADASAGHARAAIEAARSPRQQAQAHASLAAVLSDPDEAREACNAALRLLARAEDARLSLMVRNVAGSVAMRALDLDSAAAHFARVLPDASALGESRIEAAALSNLALVDHYRGQLVDAAARFEAAAAVFRRIGLRAEAAMAGGNRAAVLLELGRFDEAVAELATADEALGGRGGAVEGVVLATRANLHHMRGELDRALALYEQAAERLPSPSPHAAATSVYTALVARERGEEPQITGTEPFLTWRLAAGLVVGETTNAQAELDANRRGLPRYVADGFDALLRGSEHPWLFVTLMRRVKTIATPRIPPPATEAELLLDENGYWFEVAGNRVDIRRRGPARLLLLAMVDQHLDEPGVAFDLDALFEIGWPGQNIDIEAAYKRVYAAIGTLRRLGLDDLIVTTDDGYLIAPTALVRRD